MSVEYFLSDHLGSTSLTTNMDGAKISEMRYKPWGEVRSTWTSAAVTTPAYALTRQTFTGQYSYMDDPSTATTEGFGLMFYNARWMDPYLNHFTQPDTIVPNPYNPQDWDRYAYARNNPVKYTDPSGHDPWWCDTAKCESQYVERFSHRDIKVPLKKETTQPTASDLEDIIGDKVDEIKEDGNAVISVGIGMGTGAIACPPPVELPCTFVTSVLSYKLGVGANSTAAPFYDDATQYGLVEDALHEAVNNPSTEDALNVSMTYQKETGSLVYFNEATQYLETNPDYHPDQYVLRIEGSSKPIILTPSQAIFINSIFGGGLLP